MRNNNTPQTKEAEMEEHGGQGAGWMDVERNLNLLMTASRVVKSLDERIRRGDEDLADLSRILVEEVAYSKTEDAEETRTIIACRMIKQSRRKGMRERVVKWIVDYLATGHHLSQQALMKCIDDAGKTR